jgi:hypothetical protein
MVMLFPPVAFIEPPPPPIFLPNPKELAPSLESKGLI